MCGLRLLEFFFNILNKQYKLAIVIIFMVIQFFIFFVILPSLREWVRREKSVYSFISFKRNCCDFGIVIHLYRSSFKHGVVEAPVGQLGHSFG